tara:strand:- start:972 stop:1763 length:792 start_codon:yes stop_codon:yes gene_type:complete
VASDEIVQSPPDDEGEHMDGVGLEDGEGRATVVSSADLLARATTEADSDFEEVDSEEGLGEGYPTVDLEAKPTFRGDRRWNRRTWRPSGLRRDETTAVLQEPGPPTHRRGYRVRRVRRLVRHIEPWSVLKVSLVFYLCVWGLMVIATRMLWSAADEAGTIEKVESFIEELFALETFEFDTSQIFRIFVLGGLVLVVGGIGVTVILVILFNLISDLTGGVRFTMVEEETAVRQRRLRRGDVVVGDRSAGEEVVSSEASSGSDTV